MKIVEGLTRKPISLLMMIWGILIIGTVSYNRLSLELMPDVSSPWLSISVRYPNMSPFIIEEAIVKPIEERVSEIGGIKNLFSVSQEGEGKINIEFFPEINIKKASMYVRQKVELVRNLIPKEANEPEINRYNPSESPIYIFTLSGSDLNYARNLAENFIKRKIERIEGISNIIVSGGKLREVEINVDFSRLKSYQIGVEQLSNAINASNKEMPLGKIYDHEREIGVSFSGKITNVYDFEKVGIYTEQGKFVQVKDIALVKDGSKEKESIAKENGEERISIYIQKASGANTIEIVNEIENVTKTLSLPKGIELNVSYNQAKYIKDALNEVKFAGLIGAIIAMLIIFIFLRNLRDTLIIGISLPIAIFITIGMMFLLNINLNIMTLSGLVLGIGMLVDNNIVVLDSIKSYHYDVIKGVKAVMLPVFASTLSNMVVFLPILFIDINTRMMYGNFALVIAISLISSLIVSVFFLPTLIYNIRFKSYEIHTNWLKTIQQKFEAEKKFLWLSRFYNKMLIKSLQNRGKILIAISGLFILSLIIISRLPEKGGDFLDFNTIKSDINFNSGTTLAKANEITERIEKELKMLLYVKKLTSKIEKEKSTLNLEIELEKLGGFSIEEIAEKLNDKYKQNREATIRFMYGEESEQSNEITLEVVGDSLPDIKDKAKKLSEKLYQLPGIDSVLLRFKEPKPEIQIIADKEKLAQNSLNAKSLGYSLKSYIRGSVASKFIDDEREFDVTVKLNDLDRKDPKKIENYLIYSPQKHFVSLKTVAKITESSSETKIHRKNKRRIASVSIYFKGKSLGEMLRDVQEVIKSEPLPDDIILQIGENYKELKQRQKGIFFAVILSFLLVYMVLASLYESFLLPFIIISSVPMAFIGLIFYFYLFHVSLSLSVYIGMIILIGIVVNNGIVLVNQIKHNRSELPIILSIYQACRSRLRPVMMTTLTTIFSLLPIALDHSSGSSLWRPLAQTVIVGLINGTLLTFVIIPILYSFLGVKILGKK